MIGLTLGGRYELLDRVGGGGMALVYKGRDLLLNRFVAIKVLRQQFVNDEEFVRRFEREAQAAASLSHPNIVSIYDVGREDDTHYIVMEFIDGVNLNEMIRERAPLQADEAVRIASQICDALDHAHHNQIIHRDIKPHNILIGFNGRVKVTDFGIARAATSSTITQTGSVVGSVHYFSPEHAKGVTTGEKSDIYSLGIVLYQMLTGRLPFLGESPISVALKHLQEPFEQPRKVNPHIPQSLENIIVKAMRKNPQERYQSARAMLADLETCLSPSRASEAPLHYASDDEEEAEKTRVVPAIRPERMSTAESPVVESESNWNSDGLEEARRRWVLPTVLGVLSAILIGVLIWAVNALGGLVNPPDVRVPELVGLLEQEARDMLEESGLSINELVLREPSNEQEAGIVIKQSKPEGAMVAPGAVIQLTVSTGKSLPQMPKLTESLVEDAKKLLVRLGVDEENQIHITETYDESPVGTVLSQVPEQDEPFDPDSTPIILKVSKGREAFQMPNLISSTENEAKATVEKFNLVLPEKNITRATSYAPKGYVFQQFPAEQNEMVTEGTEVSIWVSTGYPADAVFRNFDVGVGPEQPGQESTINIKYTDARGDNMELGTWKISSPLSIRVSMVLSPDKKAHITVYRNGNFLEQIEIPYKDEPVVVPPSSEPEQTPPSGEGTEPSGEGDGDEDANEPLEEGSPEGGSE